MHLNLGDVAGHDAQHDARLPPLRRPFVHIHTGRRGRQCTACRHSKADGNALHLSGPKRHAHVGAGRPRLLVLDSVAAGQMQARCGGLDDVEWGVDLRALLIEDTHAPAEEAVVVLKCRCI